MKISILSPLDWLTAQLNVVGMKNVVGMEVFIP